MAVPTYQSGLISDWERRWRQRRAITGRGLTESEMAGITEPLLNLDYQKSLAAEERAQNQANIDRQLSLQEKAQKDSANAAKISGLADIGVGAANLYYTNKYLNLLAAKKAGTTAGATSATGAAGTPSLMAPDALSTAVPSLTAPGALYAPTATAPSLATTTSFTGAAGGGAGATGGAAAAPVLATETSFAPSIAAAESTAGTTPAAAGAWAGLSAAGGGVVGGVAGYGLAKALHANEDITQALTLGGAGAVAGYILGAEIGSVGGPVGMVVGAAIGGLVSLFDDIF